MKCLALDVVLWDVNQGTGTHQSALCNTYYGSHSIPEVGVCMLVHGRDSRGKAKTCFEFPTITPGVGTEKIQVRLF